MTDTATNNKRIAKNTVFLFIRMLLVMGVMLYTSRIILSVLGVEDYGIYNVVGGVVAMMGFINNSLAGASSRFITYELGNDDKMSIKDTFSSVLFVHYTLSIIILILAETIGLWFVYEKLVIPSDRFNAALWVYQCSVLSVIVGIISVPYNSLIIAHEKMSAFAYISIIEVVLKLLIVYLLLYVTIDKLIVYSILVLFIQVLIRLIYTIYCRVNFDESKIQAKYHRSIVKRIFSYSCWTMNGYMAIAGYTQGLNILLNLFFGPVVNAARGIAVQVQSAVMNMVANFLVAIKPQIIKSYAQNNLQYMHTLVISASKFGYFMLLMIITPLLLCTETILQIWLGVVPEYTVDLVKIMLIGCLIQPLGSAMISAIHATGDIKRFQLFEGTSLLMVVPIAYILLEWWRISPEMVMMVYVAVELVTQCIRFYIVLPKIELPYWVYLKKAILPLIIPTIGMIAILFVWQIEKNIPFWTMIGYAIISVVYIFIVILLFGLNSRERKMGIQYLMKIKRK